MTHLSRSSSFIFWNYPKLYASAMGVSTENMRFKKIFFTPQAVKNANKKHRPSGRCFPKKLSVINS
jgi:hypothetical protein